jgi:hypothetical protein
MYRIAIKPTGSYQNQNGQITNMNAINTGNFIDNKFKVVDDKIERIKHIFFVNITMYKKKGIWIRIR